jgi:hypothetical protein
MVSSARYAFSVSIVAAFLAGCGGSAVGRLGPQVSEGIGEEAPYQHTFNYTGAAQSFKVPAHVTAIQVYAHGAAGGGEKCSGSYCYPPRDYFGRGGRVHAVIPVQPDETLYVFVGGQGTSTNGGFNGGGNPGAGGGSNGGGGASDVREGGTSLNDRILVAAGGGGQGSSRDTIGGGGGGKVGGNGGDTYCYGSSCFGGGGGTGGTQSKGGSGGVGGGSDGYEPGQPGTPGTLGDGGTGGIGGCYQTQNCFCGYADGCPGAGGGGGYYGGGGAGGGDGEYASIYGGPGGGGGGGSSWAEASAKNFKTWPGWKSATGNGLVVFSWQ